MPGPAQYIIKYSHKLVMRMASCHVQTSSLNQRDAPQSKLNTARPPARDNRRHEGEMCLSRLCWTKKEQITLSSEDFTIITTAKHQARKKVSYKDGTQYKSYESLPIKKWNHSLQHCLLMHADFWSLHGSTASSHRFCIMSWITPSLPESQLFHFHFNLRLCQYVLLPSQLYDTRHHEDGLDLTNSCSIGLSFT